MGCSAQSALLTAMTVGSLSNTRGTAEVPLIRISEIPSPAWVFSSSLPPPPSSLCYFSPWSACWTRAVTPRRAGVGGRCCGCPHHPSVQQSVALRWQQRQNRVHQGIHERRYLFGLFWLRLFNVPPVFSLLPLKLCVYNALSSTVDSATFLVKTTLRFISEYPVLSLDLKIINCINLCKSFESLVLLNLLTSLLQPQNRCSVDQIKV